MCDLSLGSGKGYWVLVPVTLPTLELSGHIEDVIESILFMTPRTMFFYHTEIFLSYNILFCGHLHSYAFLYPSENWSSGLDVLDNLFKTRNYLFKTLV